ncbi:uncharacterized protein CC84DRAFT_1087926, partial [Paraphaeosphaeria sporulosa]
FEIFYDWLYTRTIYTPTEEGRIPLTFDSIIFAYVFGDAHQSPEFCNAAINALIQKCDQDDVLPLYQLNYAYENTLHDNLLRKYLTHDAVACYNFEVFQVDADSYPREFMMEVILASRELECAPRCMASGENWARLLQKRTCDYHDHSNV